MSELPGNRYLGDGVYASFDGYQLILETSNGVETTNTIALESEVYRAMEKYVEYVRKWNEERQKK